MTRRCAVVGDPASHSLSPAIHRAGYAACGLDWSYEALDLPAGQLGTFVAACRADGAWRGLSVTAPHKEDACALAEPDHVARLTGSANTLLFGEDFTAHNTDVPGFVRAWRAHGLAAPRRAAIVGNGATARSVLAALAGLEVREVTVLARNPDRAAGMLELGNTLGLTVEAAPLDDAVDGLDVLVSTIPADASAPHAAGWAAGAAVLFDVVYHPWPTPVGQQAAEAGRMALSGLDLLAGQAVDQFHLMTGQQVTFTACRSAVATELRQRGAKVPQ